MPSIDEFWRRVDKSGECWLWTAHKANGGYGTFYFDKKLRSVHRLSYEWARGPIPDGLTIDHLCRNPSCVNPDHLEPVTMRENTLRSEGPTAINARKTHCPNGHAYDESNTYRCESLPNWRYCRACNNEAGRRYRARKRASR